MNEPFYLTKEGAEKLKKELEELKGPKRKELANRLRTAIQQGDLSENADYIYTKEEQGFVEGRIQELETILREAEIIEETDEKRDQVTLGALVTIQENGHSPETYHVVGASEANPRDGKISNESPIGSELIGKKIGDEIEIDVQGRIIQFKVLNIE